MRVSSLFAVFAVVQAAAWPVLATVMVPMYIEELAASSDLVVHGVVESTRSRIDDSSGRGEIVTDVVVRVSTAIAGNARKDDVVVVTCPGGVVGGRGRIVTGAPRFEVGDEVVLFLRNARGNQVGGPVVRRVVGLAQGVFRVVRHADGGEPTARQELEGVSLVGSGDVRPMELPLGALVREVRSIFRVPEPKAGK